jgi:predicted SAM-dependent methyltransferase
MTWDALSRCDIVMIPSIERADKSVKSPNRLLEAINAGRVTLLIPAFPCRSFCAPSSNRTRGPRARFATFRTRGLRGQPGEDRRGSRRGYRASMVVDCRSDRRPIAARNRAESRAPAPIRPNLGCGDKIRFMEVDVAPARRGQKPDVICDIRQLSAFPADPADEVLAVHVVEHLWRWEVADILKEWGRVLKPGGRIILECPNLISACQALLADPINASGPGLAGQRTMWVFYGDPAWKDPLMCHRWAYTPQSLGEVMAEAGFVNIRQEPAQFKLREPRDMRVVGEKPLAQAISTAG